jgi:Family of unknown function (DUF5689)
MKLRFILILALFSGCVKENFETPTAPTCIETSLKSTVEVKSVYELAKNTTLQYIQDEVIEGVIISSDEGGNFYKSLIIQPLDKSKGFNISIDDSFLYTKNLQVGKKVFLKLKDLYFASPSDFTRGLIFGAPPTGSFPVDRLKNSDYKNYVIPSCQIFNEDEIVKKLTIDEGNSGKFINNLVEFENVQFVDEYVGGTFDTNRKDDFDSSIYITDGVKKLIVRTSRFSSIGATTVPKGKGTLRGVLTKYGTLNQITLRTSSDIQFNNPRTDYVLPKIGTNIQFESTLFENFESYETTTKGAYFAKYINDAFVGSRYWDVKSYSKNKYIQMSAFASGGTNKVYFILPVDFIPGNKLSFKTKDGSYNGNVLKVYYSINYNPEKSIDNATLTDITSRFYYAKGTVSGFAKSFTNSGTYTFPETLKGNGFLLFEYSGNIETTTTMQIDDILVEE